VTIRRRWTHEIKEKLTSEGIESAKTLAQDSSFVFIAKKNIGQAKKQSGSNQNISEDS